jgi:tetratricopeptide (TPR) repeat protein
MKEEDAQRVRENENKILQLAVSKAAKTLLNGTMYASSGLRAEALPMLENLFGESASSELALIIADLYDGAGVRELAVDWYSRARDLAHAEGGLESEARALEGLSQNLRDRARARSSLREAIEKYRALGSLTDVKRLTPIVDTSLHRK